MNLNNYYLVAFLWICICIALGTYINGVGLSGKQQYSIGLKAILFAYLFGVGALIVIIIRFT